MLVQHHGSGTGDSASPDRSGPEKYKLSGATRNDEERRLFRAYLEGGDLGARAIQGLRAVDGAHSDGPLEVAQQRPEELAAVGLVGERGQPVVPNGLPLSKIHHAAFDANLIGVDPDARVTWWNWEELSSMQPTVAVRVAERQSDARVSGAFQIYVFATSWTTPAFGSAIPSALSPRDGSARLPD